MATEKRLIDANALKQRIVNRLLNGMIVGWLCGIVDDAPTVDAVEVVRCKECKHGELDESERDDYYLCHYHGCDWNDGNHYCGYGERKGNGV